MNCPNCGAENMRTTETFKMPTETVRTKMCQVCKWKFSKCKRDKKASFVVEGRREYKTCITGLLVGRLLVSVRVAILIVCICLSRLRRRLGYQPIISGHSPNQRQNQYTLTQNM